MEENVIRIGGKKRSTFMDQVKEVLPEGGNLNLCLTCGACSSGCPATGLRAWTRASFCAWPPLGLDENILNSDWVWMCTMCQRCIYVCPDENRHPPAWSTTPGELAAGQTPQGYPGLLRHGPQNETCSAMGASEEISVRCRGRARGVRDSQPGMGGPAGTDQQGGRGVLLEPELPRAGHRTGRDGAAVEDLAPAGADWTYGTKGWGGENYCMFMADDEAWKHIVQYQGQGRATTWGAKYWLNTE